MAQRGSLSERERPSPHWHISEQQPPFAPAIWLRPRSGALPGQIVIESREGAAVGAITRLLARDNEVAIGWVPAQQSIQANERADEIAKTTAEGRSPNDMVPDEHRWETSLSRMTRVATEARPRFHMMAQWNSDHVIPNGRTASPGGVALDRSSFAECESWLPAGITSCCQDTLLLQDPFGVSIWLDK